MLSSTFQFTTSRGGRSAGSLIGYPFVSFNSRPPEEVDLLIDFLQEHDYSFNSRPPEEVDIFSGRCFQATILSIHDLPRRSTSQPPVATKYTTFQFTTSRGGRRRRRSHWRIADSFQFTTSRGGRPTDVSGWNLSGDLSIHDLPRRSTAKFHSFHL